MGGYLSAEAVVNMFNKAVMETINWPSISSTLDCLVRPVMGGSDLRLEIRCVFLFKMMLCSFPVLKMCFSYDVEAHLSKHHSCCVFLNYST